MKSGNQNFINFNDCITHTSELLKRRAGTCRKTVSAGCGSLSDDISCTTLKQRRYPNSGYGICLKVLEHKAKKT
jgi:hypothetical protein